MPHQRPRAFYRRYVVASFGTVLPFCLSTALLQFAHARPLTVTTEFFLFCLKGSCIFGGVLIFASLWRVFNSIWWRLPVSLLAGFYIIFGLVTDYSACDPLPQFREQPFEACP